VSERDFERLSSTTVWEGRIVSVDSETFRYPDGEEVVREIIRHPGAVGIVCVDDLHVWLVRQPREAADDADMLEIPAGKLDEDGESPLQTAQRELAEEIGKQAAEWEHLTTFFTSVGVMDEEVHLYLASGLSRAVAAHAEENERIEIVSWPLSDLDYALELTRDSKTLIGLLMLKARLQA